MEDMQDPPEGTAQSNLAVLIEGIEEPFREVGGP